MCACRTAAHILRSRRSCLTDDERVRERSRARETDHRTAHHCHLSDSAVTTTTTSRSPFGATPAGPATGRRPMVRARENGGRQRTHTGEGADSPEVLIAWTLATPRQPNSSSTSLSTSASEVFALSGGHGPPSPHRRRRSAQTPRRSRVPAVRDRVAAGSRSPAGPRTHRARSVIKRKLARRATTDSVTP